MRPRSASARRLLLMMAQRARSQAGASSSLPTAASSSALMHTLNHHRPPPPPPPPRSPGAAAALAASYGLASVLLASSSSSPAAAKSDDDNDNNNDVLASQRRALQSAYEEAVADWHRHCAQAPLAPPPPSPSAAVAADPSQHQHQQQPPPPRPPSIARQPGGATVATIPVRPGADVARLVAELGAGVARCASSSGASASSSSATTSVRQQSVASSIARKWRWDVSTTRPGDPPSRETLAVQAYVPRQGAGAPPHAAAAAAAADGRWGEVVVSKSASGGGAPAFSARELELVCRAAHTAAASFAPSSAGGGGLGGPAAAAAAAGAPPPPPPLRGDAFLRQLFSFGGKGGRQGGSGDGEGGNESGSSSSSSAAAADLLLAQAERLLRERGLPWLFGGGGAAPSTDGRARGDDDAEADEAADALGAWLDALFGGSATGGPRQFIPPPPFPPPPLFPPLPPAAAADGDAGLSSSSSSSSSGAPAAAPSQPPTPTHGWGSPEAQGAVRRLEALGARVYPPVPSPALTPESPLALDWGPFAGYASQKRAIEDSLLLPLLRPDVFDRLAARTRATAAGEPAAAGAPARARPRAVLFEGPPGTGKTTAARTLCQAGVPLVYVPVESLTSRWYGDSEKRVADVFKAAEQLGSAVLFLDELDSLAPSRGGGSGGGGGDIHEASRRVLGVLLREIDGFETATGGGGDRGGGELAAGGAAGWAGDGKAPPGPVVRRGSIVIGATNRAEDLDPALLSRFDLTLHFALPDAETRAAILGLYAAHLTARERKALAADAHCAGFSGRDLRDVCEQTERRFAARIVRGEVVGFGAGGGAAAGGGGGGADADDELPLPRFEDYAASAAQRREAAERREAKLAGGARLFRV